MNQKLLHEIKSAASELLPGIIRIRRQFHMYPELSFNEVETSGRIMAILEEYNIPYSTGWAGTGIVAEIQGGKGNKVIALRADMDALPISESNQTEYKSQNEGIMHACGHDVHMASLIGTAIILQRLRSDLTSNFRLIFQPGEEKLPGGASLMITEGVLKNPVPEAIIGQHVFPSLPAGKVGIRPALYMASSDEIYITVTGKGGHGGMPQDCTDAILAASHMLVALQQITSRKSDPSIPTVLSFGKINSEGGATNIIPDKVRIEGTFRTMDEQWRVKAHQWIVKVATSTCEAYGTQCEVNIVKGYPCLVNDVPLTEKVKEAMVAYLGEENVVNLPLRMTSEDFAFYSQVIPASFYRLGTGNEEKGLTAPVHTSGFDIDESSLETGIGLMAWIAVCQ